MKLFQNTYSKLTCNSQNLWLNLSYRKLLLTPFFPSSHIHQSHTLVGCHAANSNSSSIFLDDLGCLFIMPSHKFNIINSSSITIVQISIIKINFTKGYTIRAYIIGKECNKIRAKYYKTKDYIIIIKYNSIKFFNDLTRNKPIRNKFQC